MSVWISSLRINAAVMGFLNYVNTEVVTGNYVLMIFLDKQKTLSDVVGIRGIVQRFTDDQISEKKLVNKVYSFP